MRCVVTLFITGTILFFCSQAESRADTLHGYQGTAADNGTNTPVTGNNLNQPFGFTVSGGPTAGDFVVDVLVPNNVALPPSFALTGTLSGTATKVAGIPPGPWTSGQLDAYLGISASPTNPIGAYLPSTQAVDPGATGFFVFQVDLGQFTLQSPSNPNVSPLENISPSVPTGGYIVAFLNEGSASAPNWSATANSGALFYPGPNAVPEPSAVILMSMGITALGVVGWRRRRSLAAAA
jgi:hypothetical protein